MVILVVLAGFIGGFIAPYHLKKTVIRSVGTIVVLAIIFLIFLNFVLRQGPVSDDPTAGLGLTLVIFVLILGTIFVSLAGIVLVSGGGVFGALF